MFILMDGPDKWNCWVCVRGVHPRLSKKRTAKVISLVRLGHRDQIDIGTNLLYDVLELRPG
jgi:hypothetical protein